MFWMIVTTNSYYILKHNGVVFLEWNESVFLWGGYCLFYATVLELEVLIDMQIQSQNAVVLSKQLRSGFCSIRLRVFHTLARRIQSANSQMKLCATYRPFLLLCHLCPWPLAFMFVRSNVLQLNTDLKFIWQRGNYKCCKYEVILWLAAWSLKIIWAAILFTN